MFTIPKNLEDVKKSAFGGIVSGVKQWGSRLLKNVEAQNQAQALQRQTQPQPQPKIGADLGFFSGGLKIPEFIQPKPSISPIPPVNQAEALTATQPQGQVAVPQVVPPIPPAVSPAVSPTPIVPQPQFGQNLENLKNQVLALQSQVASQTVVPPTPPVKSESEIASEKAQADLAAVQKKLTESFTMSPGEIQSQEELNRLITSQRMGAADIQDKPIAMPFITGQQAALERRAGVLAEPLVSRLALLQSQRAGQQEALSSQLGFTEKGMERATAAAKLKQPEYKEVDGQIVKIDPITGKVTSIFGKPKAGKEDGITLSPEQIRYERDSTGKLVQVATGGPKQPTEKQTEKALEKQEAETIKETQSIQSMSIVNDLLANPNLDSIFGYIQGRFSGILPEKSQFALNQYDQLKAQLALGARGLLKGSGAISDYESKVLSDSTAALARRTISEESAKEALRKIRGVIKTNIGQTTEVEVIGAKESFKAFLSGKEIFDLISEGNRIEYQ